MGIELLGYGAMAIGLYALVSGRLSRSIISGPMFFTGLGIVVVASGFADTPGDEVPEVAVVALEMTLALVLFTDATATNMSTWKDEGELPSRLLGIAMPLVMVAGALAAVVVVPGIDLIEAAIVAVILAPTDAALGKPVVSNTRVPVRIREALNIESGLNDGIALPFLLFFIAVAEAEAGGGIDLVSLFVSSIGVALVVGLVVAWGSARLILLSSERGWMVPMWRQIAVVSTAIVAYIAADELGGSGFIATFVGGLIFGRLTLSRFSDIGDFSEDVAEVMTMTSFMIFGAVGLQPSFGDFTWEMLLYAVLSLTIVRFLPVVISMIGTHLRLPSLLYMGWFGPRGLASLIFATILLEESDIPAIDPVITVITLTVGLSILLHGITAFFGSNAYADWYERQREDEDDMVEHGGKDPGQRRRRIFRS